MISAKSPEVKIALAGQIARALAVFCVDEVVIFEDDQGDQSNPSLTDQATNQTDGIGHDYYTGYSKPSYFLMHILSYLETPPHFRKNLFPMHPDLKLAGSLPSLDMPHHMRSNDWCQYREGVTVPTASSNRGSNADAESLGRKKQKSVVGSSLVTTFVDVGLSHNVPLSDTIDPNTRVTVKFADNVGEADMNKPDLTATAVLPSAPREEAGYYWGYSVRAASSISAVLTECPFDGGYDVTFGTSERGTPISTLNSPTSAVPPLPKFNHMLIAFGGVAGLEVAVQADPELGAKGVSKPDELFDYWVDLCPGQGSRTIRTEEAVWLGLMGLRDVVLRNGRK